MENKYKRNGVMYFLVVLVTIIVFLVIHLYYGGLSDDIYQCNAGIVDNNIYTIKNGDTLEIIARMYNTTVEELMKANNLTSTDLLPGQQIIIPVDEQSGTKKQPVNNIIAFKEKEEGKEPVNVDKIKLTTDKITMTPGSKKRIVAIIEPYNATNKSLVWESSDPSIATVDSNGNIVALKEGEVTITVRTKDGKVKAEVKVKVAKTPIDKIILTPTKMSLKVGTSGVIATTIKPDNATVDELIWESSDPSVAKVDNEGRVHGLKEGTAIITAKTPDGKVTATCVVTIVSASVPVDKIKFDKDKVSVKVGETNQLIANIEPENATERELIWESSDPSIVKVDENGKITGVKPGTATITVKTPDGKVVATCTVKVEPIPVEDIILNTNKIDIKVGESEKLIAIIEPEDATDKKLIWESSDSSIATVDSNGKITGIKPGTTTITVKTPDGKIKETCIVKVEKIKVEEIVLNPTTMSLKINTSAVITSVIKPDNATEKDLIWESSDPSIAKVDNKGRVTGVKEGTAVITARTPDGTVKSTCVVNIVSDTVPIEKITFDKDNVSIKVGESDQLIANIEPSNATERDLIWESSDPSIATVDSNGKITGIKPGTTTITVKTPDGKVVATCTVKVEEEIIDDDIIFTYEFDNDNYIYLINQFPIKDEVGKNLQGDKHTNDFKLKFNEKAVGVKYTITIEKLDGSDLAEKWTKQFLVNDGADVQNCYRANNRVKTFNEYEMYNNNPKERIIYEGVVSSNEATRGYKDFTFRMWVSEDLKLVNSDYLSEAKTFKARINVYAVGN